MVNAQKKPKIPSKRRKFQKHGDELKDDRISALPDHLILEILSRLPSTKEAIKTGTLSKRWKHLWTCVPTLIFKEYDHNLYGSDFVSVVEKTLTQCRQSELNKFQIKTNYDIQFVSQFNNWIRWAISRNPQELKLGFSKMLFEPGFLLDHSFFTASCFTHLTLEDCMFDPIGPISWKNLRTLSISYAKLDEDLIGNILSGSPQLETLVLHYCYGYRRLNITSKSVKNFVFSGYDFLDDDVSDGVGIIEIDAPHILSLKITCCLCVWKLSLLKVSSLLEANLDYTLYDHYETTTLEEAEEDMLKGLMLNLRHVKELNISDSCSKVLSGLQAKGFIVPSNVKCHGVTRY